MKTQAKPGNRSQSPLSPFFRRPSVSLKKERVVMIFPYLRLRRAIAAPATTITTIAAAIAM
jgi:hypothetical protein